jgi:seryl-tRNA synthetase
MEISEIPGNTYQGGNISTESIENLGMVKVDALKESIAEIESQLAERRKISHEFEREGNKMKLNIKNFLLENAPVGDDDSDFARERAELRRKQIDLSEMQLNEMVNCWRDVVLLQKDLRDKQKELFERENRMSAINDILEGD